MKVLIGQMVRSTAGRDKGKYYVVTGIIDSSHVLVADGMNRLLSRPKKKNIRHLQLNQKVLPQIADKMKHGQATDAELSRALKAWKGESIQV